MTEAIQVSRADMAPPDPCWIIRSPDGQFALKDEDWDAVLAFSAEELASAFGAERVGAGNFQTQKWGWDDLAAKLPAEGFAGAMIDRMDGASNRIILFTSTR